MKISKTSTVARIPASLKFAALAACFLVPAGMFAETDARPTSGKTTPPNSLAFKTFYEVAQGRALLWSSVPEVDLGGLTVEYTRNMSSNVDFVIATSLGGGSSEYERTSSYYNGSYYSTTTYSQELTIATYEVEVGVNLNASLGDVFSVFVGPRIGVNFLFAQYDNNGDKEHDTELGLLYGVDAGAVFSFNNRNALTLGIGSRASTAQPLDIEKQSWVRFSISYRFSF